MEPRMNEHKVCDICGDGAPVARTEAGDDVCDVCLGPLPAEAIGGPTSVARARPVRNVEARA